MYDSESVLCKITYTLDCSEQWPTSRQILLAMIVAADLGASFKLQRSAIAFGGPDGIGPPSRPPRCGHQWHRTFPSTKPEFRASGLGHDMLTCMTLKVLEAPLRHPFGKQSSTVIFCLRVDSQRISSHSSFFNLFV